MAPATKQRKPGSPTAFLRTRRIVDEAMPRFIFSARLEGEEFAAALLKEFRKELSELKLKPPKARARRSGRSAQPTAA
jgi:hypothetical protein